MSISEFTEAFAQSLADASFIKLSLGTYRGDDAQLQKILARKILVKRVEKVSVTSRYATRDIVKNYDLIEAGSLIQNYLNHDFGTAHLFTTGFDLQYDGKKLTRTTPTQQAPGSLAHDRVKQRVITADKPYLHALNITDRAGKIHPTAQDKYRQINKYIEILDGLIAPLRRHRAAIRIADMGAGKGYLTFALYDHLVNQCGFQAQVTGVEFRPELVALCNRVAAESGFTGLAFVPGSIQSYDATGIDVLIALHACDTATDDAIAKGIQAQAELIVVAPCCHHQIRKEMEAAPPAAPLNFMLKHGILLERQAEMVTDGLRALLLELHGYKTKLFEFISDAHTSKNVMITAVRGSQPTPSRKQELLQEIAAAKQQFGIHMHMLESLLRNPTMQ